MRPIRIVCCLILLMVTGCFRPQVPPITLDRDWGERKTYDYHGVKINYYESGQGQPILLLHGFGASSYSWRFLGPSLAENHRVIMIDLKGYGLSDRPRDQKYSVSDQADIVADFIRQQDSQEMVLIGHSMGGMVALMTYFKMGRNEGGG